MRDASSIERIGVRRRPLIVASAVLAVLIVAAHFVSRSQFAEPVVQPARLRAEVDAAPMCPWRHPEADRRAFFPGADRHETKTAILSDQLTWLQQQLGRWPLPDENPLYLHQIYQGSRHVGTVVARRVKGEYGAIEIVLAVDVTGQVVGLRLQRLREPETVSGVLRSGRWLQSFNGITFADRHSPGGSVQLLPAPAHPSARAIAEGVRSLLILLEAVRRRGVSGSGAHH